MRKQMTNTTPLLDIQNLSQSYKNKEGKIQVLNQISWSIGENENIALVGASGSGKTTLLRAIAGLESIDAGEIKIDGQLLVCKNFQKTSSMVGFVFQHGALFPHLSVEKNIAFGIPKHPQKRERVQEMLALVQLQDCGKRFPHQLSGGQRQRVALVRALVRSPKVLLLDEPFSGLDEATRDRIRDDLFSILDTQKITSIFVTHDSSDAEKVGSKIYKINEGTLKSESTPALEPIININHF